MRGLRRGDNASKAAIASESMAKSKDGKSETDKMEKITQKGEIVLFMGHRLSLPRNLSFYWLELMQLVHPHPQSCWF